MIAPDDVRLSPILTYAEVAAILDTAKVGPQSVYRWAHRANMVTTSPNLKRGWPTVPVVGLLETHVIAQLLNLGASPRRVARFARFLRDQYGQHALAVPKYVTDGYDLYEKHGADELSNAITGQGAFMEVLRPHLQEIKLWPDGMPGSFQPARLRGLAEIDPRFNAGRVSFIRNRVPLFAVAGALEGGDHPVVVQHDYGLTDDEMAVVDENRDWLREAA
jgi:hypothetical protein